MRSTIWVRSYSEKRSSNCEFSVGGDACSRGAEANFSGTIEAHFAANLGCGEIDYKGTVFLPNTRLVCSSCSLEGTHHIWKMTSGRKAFRIVLRETGGSYLHVATTYGFRKLKPAQLYPTSYTLVGDFCWVCAQVSTPAIDDLFFHVPLQPSFHFYFFFLDLYFR